MKEVKLLYLNTDISESVDLRQLLVNRLQEDRAIIESYPAIAATPVIILEFLTRYDIIIFDGTIEDNAELNNAKYDFLDPSIQLRDNFFVITRNTLPMNIVPAHSNLNQFGALRNNMYQIDRNRFDDSSNDGIISNNTIVDWIQQEIKSFIATHEDYHKPKTPLEVIGNLKNDVGFIMNQYKRPQKKQIFVSFRGRYQNDKKNVMNRSHTTVGH